MKTAFSEQSKAVPSKNKEYTNSFIHIPEIRKNSRSVSTQRPKLNSYNPPKMQGHFLSLAKNHKPSIIPTISPPPVTLPQIKPKFLNTQPRQELSNAPMKVRYGET